MAHGWRSPYILYDERLAFRLHTHESSRPTIIYYFLIIIQIDTWIDCRRNIEQLLFLWRMKRRWTHDVSNDVDDHWINWISDECIAQHVIHTQPTQRQHQHLNPHRSSHVCCDVWCVYIYSICRRSRTLWCLAKYQMKNLLELREIDGGKNVHCALPRSILSLVWWMVEKRKRQCTHASTTAKL